MANRDKRIEIPFTAYFGEFGAILTDYKQWHEYADNPTTGKSEKTGKQLGMAATVVSPYLGFEPVSVKVACDMEDFVCPDLEESFDSGKYVFVEFDGFKGGSYTDKDGKKHYTGKATRIYLADPDTIGK